MFRWLPTRAGRSRSREALRGRSVHDDIGDGPENILEESWDQRLLLRAREVVGHWRIREVFLPPIMMGDGAGQVTRRLFFGVSATTHARGSEQDRSPARKKPLTCQARDARHDSGLCGASFGATPSTTVSATVQRALAKNPREIK